MRFINESVNREYDWWSKQLDAEDPYASDTTVGIHDVLRAHFLIVDYFVESGEGIGGAGPRDLNLLHSALSRQFVGFGGRQKWTNVYETAATLFYGLVKNHAFHDANKRTALLTTLFHLHSNGQTPEVAQKELDKLTVRIAEDELGKYGAFDRFHDDDDAEVRFLAWYLRRNTRPIDKRHYLITYRQLDQTLHKYGCWLDNPNNNRIDVMKNVRESHGLFGRKTHEVARRVAIIGFPGWTTEVSRKDIQEVRRAASLTLEDGIDSTSFFKGADSMDALISVYRGPLKRLANK